MASKVIYTVIMVTLLVHVATSNDSDPIPADKGQVERWFRRNVQPFANSKSALDPNLVKAEETSKVITVSQDGKGNFKTITDAVKSIPIGNTQRIIVAIAGGTYTEKIEVHQSYVTFYGNHRTMPTIVFDGTEKVYGGYYSCTVTVNGNYFVAANINFKNSAPRPDPAKRGGQAVALGITGQKAAIYNSKIFGYQDTLLDEGREHFYKDCYIEGTVDFIFGRGKTIFLNNELHVVVPGNVGFQANVITSHSRNTSSADEGYSFVHCFVTGTGGNSILGRALFAYASVVYSYTDISDILDPLGWARNNKFASTVFFREYKNSGARAGPVGRVPYSKQLSDAEVKPFLSLSYIQGSKWLLPPPTL